MARAKSNPLWGGTWTTEADEILYANYGQWPAMNVANKINSRLGTRFTTQAIRTRVRELGIDSRSCQGLLNMTDAAKELGISHSGLQNLLNLHQLETTGKGKHRYLTPSTWATVQERYKEPPEKCITTVEAARRLCYSTDTITKTLIPAGKLRAYKFGQRWLVSVEDIERLEREQRGVSVIGDLSPELGKKRR